MDKIRVVSIFTCLIAVLFGEIFDLRAAELVPHAVWTSAETTKDHAAANMIDGSIATWSQVLDDTRTGTKKNVLPSGGSTPVTAIIVFDLGKIQTTGGIRLTAQKSHLCRLPQNASFFACDDQEGKVNRYPLAERVEFPPVSSSNSAFAQWRHPVKARYIAMRINDSWEKDFNPGISSGDIQYDVAGSEFRYKAFPNSGWWMGLWGNDLATLNLEAPGFGSKFLVDIAEVSFFKDIPDDFVRANPRDVAFPKDRLVRDWMNQDHGFDITDCFVSRKNADVEKAMVKKVLDELTAEKIDTRNLQKRKTNLENIPGLDPRWKALYFDACQKRREIRLQLMLEETRQIVYAKHCMLGGWTGANGTEDISDGEFDIHNPDWRPGSQLCLMTFEEDGHVKHEVLLEKKYGIIRDPNFSFDCKTLVFSMRDNFYDDDYHLYSMDMATRKIKQITFSPVINEKVVPCSDTEPCFTGEGKIVFMSTRHINQDICWIVASGNLFTCEADGSKIRRLGIDQLHTYTPNILNDGRIIYTRWEYNDRVHGLMQALFTMNADGTGQTEFYGNNSWYPTAIYFPCSIPESNKVLGIVSSHHAMSKGKLALIDPSKGTQGNAGIEFVAGASPDGKPGRQPSRVLEGKKWQLSDRWPTDNFGQTGTQFISPFAFDESHYLCGVIPEGSCYQKGPFSVPFGIYYLFDDGRRELLAFDWTNSSCQAVARVEREKPVIRHSSLDLAKPFGQYYVDDIYFGPGLKGVPRGTVKKIRVVALEYRSARLGTSPENNRGIGGDTPVQTPVSISNGSYDVKHILGEINVEKDGSALFEVPACTPVYFQMLDEKGFCVQTMRSWSTLMPGEFFACLGCHEDKRETKVNQRKIAMDKPAQKLHPHANMPHPLLERLNRGDRFASLENYLNVNQPRDLDAKGPFEGFSYMERIQPIFDRHCAQCHLGDPKNPDKKKSSALDLTNKRIDMGGNSMRLVTPGYLTLTKEGSSISCSDELDEFVKKNGKLPMTVWYHPQGPATMIPPYSAGSGKSRLMNYLEPTHYNVQLTDNEKQTVACWIDLSVPFCGSCTEANQWTKYYRDKYIYYDNKRKIFGELEMNDLKKK